MFADWTDRIEEWGDSGDAQRDRKGLKEMWVIQPNWDWADPKAYLHDLVFNRQKKPDGQCKWSDIWRAGSQCRLPSRVDPVNHTASRVSFDRERPRITPVAYRSGNARQLLPMGGGSHLGTAKPNVHNPMLDEEGRVWITACSRPFDNPGSL